MNRTLAVGAGIGAVVALALTGCAASGTPADDPDEKVTITYSNFISNGGNEDNLATIVDAFEKENPTITVDVKTLPYDSYGTALDTDLAAGTAADVFDINGPSAYGQYQANGVLAPLDGVDASLYSPSLLSSYATDGTQYALPTSFSDVVLFYNKALFDKAGLDYPTADWTWTDETAAAEKLTDQAAGVWGDHQPVTYNEFYKVLVQNGASFLSPDGKSVAFNTPAGLEAANWLVQKSGTTMPTIEDGQGTADFDTNLFKDGKLAMLHTGIWMFGAFADDADDWDIAVEPGNTQHANAVFSNAIGVSATSKHPEAAQKWAEFMSSSDTMVDVRLDSGWELPPIADSAKLATYLDKGKPENRQAVFDAAKEIAPAPSIGDNQSEMQDDITNELIEAQAGRETVQQALDNAEKKINALLQG
ncbi:sugar ABC transporter substrate-binding protein [Galbitalea sp. SE-J8]|uniref:ABC transporter substrate-binding protein n=1 Tax=Galbitalea sp. SE-J8 TaxID=3054952 RepID=UPI00259D1EA7|nr:sugar ABC transporter substrate-binding protein [Galbitalea sp. SE-J8]MDM4762080.1 sugar ABC transporter substrate-binding protein [Galbitalea sp. SE-J8]